MEARPAARRCLRDLRAALESPIRSPIRSVPIHPVPLGQVPEPGAFSDEERGLEGREWPSALQPQVPARCALAREQQQEPAKRQGRSGVRGRAQGWQEDREPWGSGSLPAGGPLGRSPTLVGW
jgi:hypothetical protein